MTIIDINSLLARRRLEYLQALADAQQLDTRLAALDAGQDARELPRLCPLAQGTANPCILLTRPPFERPN